MSKPAQDELETALRAAGSAHHDYEQTTLAGKRDVQWAGFYAAYTLGRVGDFTASSNLSQWLQEAPGGGHWAATAASSVISRLSD